MNRHTTRADAIRTHKWALEFCYDLDVPDYSNTWHKIRVERCDEYEYTPYKETDEELAEKVSLSGPVLCGGRLLRRVKREKGLAGKTGKTANFPHEESS